MLSRFQSLFLKHRRSVTEANQRARIISRILLAIMSCVFVLLLMFSFSFRSFVMRHPGLIAVLIGVAGVEFFEWKEEHGPHKTWKRWFTVVLVLGLTYELIEASETDKQASEANEQAGSARERAALAESNSIALSMQVERLRGQNLKLARDLEKLRRPRWLVFNGQAFAKALKDTPKMDLQIWYPPQDAESLSLIDLELKPALEKSGWKIAEERPFMPVDSSTLEFSTPFSVQVGLNNNPVDILVGTDIFWETVGTVWNRDDIKTAPKSLSKAFKDSGICWEPIVPKAYWGASPIPTNTIRIIVFPKNL